jgi:hypothetical protein
MTVSARERVGVELLASAFPGERRRLKERADLGIVVPR